MKTHQSPEELARANGFHSFVELLAASQRIPSPDEVGHFAAITSDGDEFLWDDDEVDQPDLVECWSGSDRVE